jgi:TolB-like protein/class 3 adenylate cyclase/tetratricopeptide (TPR) repeat protein
MAEARVERRLAAILAADIAGYSRLTGADEVGTLAALKAYRREVVDPAIAGHKGRIVKTTGDGMLVVFASAVDAVACAVAIQEKMAERAVGKTGPHIQFRVGINVGDIIIDGKDIFGDGVNVAARVENECEPGGVCLSGNAFEQVRGKTSFDFDDLGERSLKNIDRPVRLYAVRSASFSTKSPVEADKPLPLPNKPSIAVLPFQNLSGDPEQEYFADGMVEEIITALSRFKGLFVIARNSSFIYKGKAIEIKQVGRELGVRYVLEGSVRKSGSRVRITGQLIEAGTGGHLWADKFDGELKEVFELQDRITASVVSVIAPKIQRSEIERARSKPTDHLDSYDFFLRGIAATSNPSKWGKAEPRDWFIKACDRDPSYAAAQIMLAYCAVTKQAVLGVPLSEEERMEAIRIAEGACALANDDPFVLCRAAHLFAYLGRDFDRGEAMIEEAVSLNPNDAAAWSLRGWISLICVQSARAIESFERKLQLSPLDPGRTWDWNGISLAHFLLGQYDQGRAMAAKALAVIAHVHTLSALIMNDVGAGRLDEARAIAGRLLQLRPDFRASYARQDFTNKSDEWSDRFVALLREAGLPE